MRKLRHTVQKRVVVQKPSSLITPQNRQSPNSEILMLHKTALVKVTWVWVSMEVGTMTPEALVMYPTKGYIGYLRSFVFPHKLLCLFCFWKKVLWGFYGDLYPWYTNLYTVFDATTTINILRCFMNMRGLSILMSSKIPLFSALWAPL